ncbi:TPA: type 1 fimbrial protein [Salmonella enterica]|nr:type 1 fimbrial protein [Salmonella enterica subsp. enterica serovar Isaszeg]HCH9279047.1 type 1 fimbrial protein [Salmonella enterica]
MKKTVGLALLISVYPLITSVDALAGIINTDTANTSTKPYKFSSFTMPNTAGGTTWFDDWGEHWLLSINASSKKSYIDFTVNGEPTGGTTTDDATVYKTNNPGVGIAYQMSYTPAGVVDPGKDFTAPFRLDVDSNVNSSGYLIIRYILVRLTDELPAGPITEVPTVTVSYHNPAGSGYGDVTFVARSGVASQPRYTACGINAPTEIKLPVLYGSNIINGAQNVVDIPTIKLTNCPGAINGISYMFKASYGEHDAANGVINTETGTGYARGVFVQLQNADGTGFNKFNTNIPLDYTGSGDYDIPNYKVGYYIDDGNSVTAGNVKSALEFDVNYN